MSRASRARKVAAAALYGGGSLGAVGAGLYGLIIGESKLARRRIKPTTVPPPHADGIWHGTDTSADPTTTGITDHRDPIRLAVVGDSSAAGLGVHTDAETPGAVLAVGISTYAHRPVELTSTAVVGARSADLAAQVDTVLAAPHRPDVVALLIGANDVTHRVPQATAVRQLGDAVSRLRAAGCQVVVGTCPDLGTIKPIAQPLRMIARRLSRTLAAAQTIATVEAGGRTVSLGDMLGPTFAKSREYFSEDQFHPSATGYRAAAEALLPSVLAALGIDTDTEPAGPFTTQKARPVAQAAARAVARPGTEVVGAEVSGEDRGQRGRWARLLRRQPATE